MLGRNNTPHACKRKPTRSKDHIAKFFLLQSNVAKTYLQACTIALLPPPDNEAAAAAASIMSAAPSHLHIKRILHRMECSSSRCCGLDTASSRLHVSTCASNHSKQGLQFTSYQFQSKACNSQAISHLYSIASEDRFLSAQYLTASSLAPLDLQHEGTSKHTTTISMRNMSSLQTCCIINR